MATISTHNGNSVALDHNRRDEAFCKNEAHIDLSLPHETWLDIDHAQAYKNLFGKAQDEYNAKQKRSDRKVDDYFVKLTAAYEAGMEKFSNWKKNHPDAKLSDINSHKPKEAPPIREMIIGIYGDETLSDLEKKNIMKRFVDEFAIRNPNMMLVGAYYHADEPNAEPHVHLDYIPFANCNRGLAVQNTMKGALREMGFSDRDENGKEVRAKALNDWIEKENESLERLCNEYGIVVEHPQKGTDVKHKPTREYKKELSKQVSNLEEQIEQKKAELISLNANIDEKQNKSEELDKTIAEKITFIDELNTHIEDLNEYLKNVMDKFKRDIVEAVKTATKDLLESTTIKSLQKVSEAQNEAIKGVDNAPRLRISLLAKLEEAKAQSREIEEAKKAEAKQYINEQSDQTRIAIKRRGRGR